MTEDQAVTREERVAIMTICGNCSEEEAQRYCDGLPWEYGTRDRQEKQETLL